MEKIGPLKDPWLGVIGGVSDDSTPHNILRGPATSHAHFGGMSGYWTSLKFDETNVNLGLQSGFNLKTINQHIYFVLSLYPSLMNPAVWSPASDVLASML